MAGRIQTHAEMLLITRREGKVIAIWPVSTGNCNPGRHGSTPISSYPDGRYASSPDVENIVCAPGWPKSLIRLNKALDGAFLSAQRFIEKIESVAEAARRTNRGGLLQNERADR